MRLSLCFFAWLIAAISCHAQNSVSLKYYKDSAMVQRWDASTEKAIAAMDANKAPKPGKLQKQDPSLKTEFSGKTFSSGGGAFGKPLAGQKEFQFDQKVSPDKFATRSFFGIKNPWFGRKTLATDKASLWSKTDVANADKSFAVDSANTREFYQADKVAGERMQEVPTRSTKVEAKAQGMMDSISNQKNLTVEQVRELLNKNH